MFAGLGVIFPGAIALPVRGIFRVGFEALLLIATFPVTFPADCGEKVTLNDVLCPGESVTGRLIPLRLNPVPVAFADEIVIVEPPEFVTVSDSD